MELNGWSTLPLCLSKSYRNVLSRFRNALALVVTLALALALVVTTVDRTTLHTATFTGMRMELCEDDATMVLLDMVATTATKC